MYLQCILSLNKVYFTGHIEAWYYSQNHLYCHKAKMRYLSQFSSFTLLHPTCVSHYYYYYYYYYFLVCWPISTLFGTSSSTGLHIDLYFSKYCYINYYYCYCYYYFPCLLAYFRLIWYFIFNRSSYIPLFF